MTDDTNQNIQGKDSWSLVTGASAGIGEEFARQLAAKQVNLVLVARRKDKLEQLAQDLENQYGIQTRTAVVDLMQQDFLENIEHACANIEITLLISNAGHSSHMGSFLKRNIEDIEQVLHFNTLVQVKLVHYFAKKMAIKQRGRIIMVSSIAGYGPIPYMAEYSSSKAYQLVFGEALHYELKKEGIDLLVLSPGATKTERIHYGMEVGPVVSKGLAALGKRPSIVPGFQNNLKILVSRYFKTRKKYLFDFGNRIEKRLKG